MTTILLTKIPFYKEVILMSFRCEHCGFTNCELQSGSKIQERGVTYKVKIKDREDLNLQIVKSDTATLQVPELELEVPSDSQVYKNYLSIICIIYVRDQPSKYILLYRKEW